MCCRWENRKLINQPGFETVNKCNRIYKKVDQFQFFKKYEWKINDQLRKRVVKYIKPTGLNYVNKYRREKNECKPGVQAARTYRNCKVHCRQLKTAQYSADSDNQGTLSSKTVYQQCCKARPPQLLVVYLSTFLFAQVLIRSERMYRCRRPIIFRLINLAFLTLFVTAILVVPLTRSMLRKREVEFKLRSVILPKQIEISMFMYYCNPGKRRAD